MTGHNLMQAIARVNRLFVGKEGGLMVDDIGIAAELKNALATYTQAKSKGEMTLKAEQALEKLLEKVDGKRYAGRPTVPATISPTRPTPP